MPVPWGRRSFLTTYLSLSDLGRLPDTIESGDSTGLTRSNSSDKPKNLVNPTKSKNSVGLTESLDLI